MDTTRPDLPAQSHHGQAHLYTAACCCEDLQPALAGEVFSDHHTLGAALIVHLRQTGVQQQSRLENALQANN